MAIDPKQIQAAFLEVVQAAPAERAAILDRACAGDAELRRRVELLVRAHDDSGDLPPAGYAATDAGAHEPHSATTEPRSDLQSGSIFAERFKLREKLGEGGMGIVWVADQTAPVQRRVALKVIKTADDSRRLLARFEQERQALAVMDHPNIAKVLDAGVSDEGRPYFVMELIKGVPITKYCDEAKLTPKERLELFVPVCQAVQHAHQKGIIHRDLKPSNILVGLYDGRPVPKVIDFGVAKATGPQLSEQSIYTEVGALIGTLEYMSPEQAELNNLDIDTRSDIYALGVILYELLTGGVPFSRRELKAAGFAEMLRIIKEVEPPKPSTRLSGSGTLPSVAAVRNTEPSKLTRLVRGELDWIVMKCLEKDRSRRYETANGLATDIRHYLADETVAAGPPTASYRLRKFARRNKPQVIAATFVFLALLAGIAGTTWGLLEARSQRDQAEQAQKDEADRAKGERLAKLDAKAKQADAERQMARAEAGEKLARERLIEVAAEKKKAEDEKQIAQSVRDFLQNKLLGQADPRMQADALRLAGGRIAEARENPTIRELLDRAAKELVPERIDGSFPDQPLVQAAILQTVGEAYRGVGEYEPAIGFLQRAVALRRQKLGADHPETLSTMNDLVLAYEYAGKPDLAVPLCEETLKVTTAKLGPDHPDTLICMNNMALAYHYAGKLDRALPLYQAALKLRKAKFGPDHPDTLMSMNNLACAYQESGKPELAIPLLQDTAQLMKARLGPDHPDTLMIMNNLALAYQSAGKPDLAIPLGVETLKRQKAKLGADHPNTLATMHNLALAYESAGKPDLALPLCEETLKLMKAKLGPDHPDTLVSMCALASAYEAVGKPDLALPLFEETLPLMQAKLGVDHPRTLATMYDLAVEYYHAGKVDRAVPLFEETLKLMQAKLGADHPATLVCMSWLAHAYSDSGRLDAALPLYEETLKFMKAKLGLDHPETLTCLENLANAYLGAGKLDLAIPLYKEALELKKAKLGDHHPDTITSMGMLAEIYRNAGKIDLAISLGEETLKLHSETYGPDRPETPIIMGNLALAYEEAGKLDFALPLLEKSLKRAKETLGPDNPSTIRSMSNLGDAYRVAGKLDLALPLLEEALKLSKKKLGPDDPETLTIMHNLGLAYWRAKQFDKSIPMFEVTLKLQEVKLGRQHPQTLQSAAILGVNYHDAGRFAEALPLLEEAQRAAKKYPVLHFVDAALLDGYARAGKTEQAVALAKEQLEGARTQFPKNSPQLAGQLAQIGLALLEAHACGEAEPLLRECLVIRDKTQPDDWTTFGTKSMLGGALLGQKKYAEAEPLLLAGYQGMKEREAKIPPQGKVRLTEALRRLVQLDEALDKKDEAAKWRKELEAGRATPESPKLEKPNPTATSGTPKK